MISVTIERRRKKLDWDKLTKEYEVRVEVVIQVTVSEIGQFMSGNVDSVTGDIRGGLYADATDPLGEKMMQNREGYINTFLEKVRCEIQSTNGNWIQSEWEHFFCLHREKRGWVREVVLMVERESCNDLIASVFSVLLS